ncbi:hypothetical protein C8F04DRAFT_973593, partial [Mycena alexandri]
MFPALLAPEIPLGGKRKVHTELFESSPPRPQKWKAGEDDGDDADRNSQHRGRAKVYALQAGLRKELLGCKTHKEFWDFVRKRTDARPRKAKVPLEGLSSNFKARLNYPAVVPPTFNAEQLAFNKRMAEELRPGLVDSSPRQSYTRDITIEEIEAMKRHIISHGL